MSTLQSNLLENHTPTGREEAWRFTPLKRLAGLHDGSAKPENRDSLTLNGIASPGVSFTRGAITAASPSEDAIVNRIRNYTAEGAILAIEKNTVVAAPISTAHLAKKIERVLIFYTDGTFSESKPQ